MERLSRGLDRQVGSRVFGPIQSLGYNLFGCSYVSYVFICLLYFMDALREHWCSPTFQSLSWDAGIPVSVYSILMLKAQYDQNKASEDK